MGRSITTSLLLGTLAVAGCGDDLGACDKQANLTGSWEFSLTPLEPDAIPRPVLLHAQLDHRPRPPGTLKLTRFVWGTISSDDPGFFGTLTIPRLLKNDGSKTGAQLGCSVQLNVPIETAVTDDDVDQGPLRLALGGKVVARGQMTSKPEPELSTVILVEDATMTPGHFTWSAVQLP